MKIISFVTFVRVKNDGDIICYKFHKMNNWDPSTSTLGTFEWKELIFKSVTN